MKYIIEVPEEITSCAKCPLKKGNIKSRCSLSSIDITDAVGLNMVAHSCPLQPYTMRSQEEVEAEAEKIKRLNSTSWLNWVLKRRTEQGCPIDYACDKGCTYNNRCDAQDTHRDQRELSKGE